MRTDLWTKCWWVWIPSEPEIQKFSRIWLILEANLAKEKLKNLPSLLLLHFDGDKTRKATYLSNVFWGINWYQCQGCPRVLENLEILEMSSNFFFVLEFVLEFTIFRVLSWKCPRIFLLQFTIFLVIISARVPSTLKNLEKSLLSLILFDNLTLDFLCL